jgi:excisionase family DNA binding protein
MLTGSLADWLTIEEVAARRGCSGSTVWRWVRGGRLTTERVFGRVVIRASDVDALPGPRGGGRWRPAVVDRGNGGADQ